MDTNTLWPLPVFSRCMRAARMPIKRCMPLLLSPSAAALTVGGPSQKPVVEALPPAHWATFSYDLRSEKGEPSGKPLTTPKIRRGLSSWICSQVKPWRSSAPGAMFSTITSERRINSSRIALPSGFFVSISSDRLFAVDHGEVQRVYVRDVAQLD